MTTAAQVVARSPLLAWLEDPRADAGLRFSSQDGGWRCYAYPEFAELVSQAAAWVDVSAAGSGPVASVLPTGPAFAAALFGTLLAGRTPCPLAPPVALQRPDEYREHAARILRVARPSLVVTDRDLEAIVRDAAARAEVDDVVHVFAAPAERSDPPVRRSAEIALLQFTSGSSGSPRGVRVTQRNLEENVRMIRTWTRLRPSDECATWLPMFHDMGLIGCLITPVVTQNSVWIMAPEEFIRTPQRWLACFGRGSATIAVAPGFAFGYLLKRVEREALEGMDFSGWTTALIGAERIEPGTLLRFAQLTAPYGFRPEAYLFAYGLAEATLAVTGGTPRSAASLARVEWDRLGIGRPVHVCERARMRLADVERVAGASGWLASCGRAHPGVEVAIVDDEGGQVDEGRLGEIRIAGETVAAGYQGIDDVAASRFTDEGLQTGDAGFVLDGELYVVGRIGDSLTIRGRNLYMEDVEDKLTVLPGIRKGRCVAIAGTTSEGQVLVAVVEGERGPWVDAAGELLRHAVGSEVPVQILAGGPGTIERTSSGKPRRRAMWSRLIEGRLRGEVVLAWSPCERTGGSAGQRRREPGAPRTAPK